MSVLAALSELTHCTRIGGGSVLTLPLLAELMTHLDSGACSEELLYAMADVPRQPTPSEWDAMRAGTPLRPGLPATIQERAYSSPIWLIPR